VIANPRVEPAIQDIGQKVSHNHQASEHENHGLYEWIVMVDDAIDE
jgi:hypothetical protein